MQCQFGHKIIDAVDRVLVWDKMSAFIFGCF